jgi:hypothetical protein
LALRRYTREIHCWRRNNRRDNPHCATPRKVNSAYFVSTVHLHICINNAAACLKGCFTRKVEWKTASKKEQRGKNPTGLSRLLLSAARRVCIHEGGDDLACTKKPMAQ